MNSGPPPRRGGDGKTTCVQCGGRLGFFAQIASKGLCKDCERTLGAAYQRFTDAFRALVRTRPSLGPNDVSEVRALAARLGLPLESALFQVKAECIDAVRRQFAIVKMDGVVDAREEALVVGLQRALMVTDAEAGPILQELEYIKTLQGVRAGKLVPVQTSAVLPVGEICYQNAPCVYHKMLKASIKTMPGLLVVTSQRLIFMSDAGGFDFGLSKIASVTVQDARGISLALTRTQGAGYYQVHNPEIVVAIITHLLGKHHRLVDVQQSASRSIPQHMKAEVWARDGGCCVQCRDRQYLEFDHVIPIHLGGATSVDNLQILCRACNLKKGARI